MAVMPHHHQLQRRKLEVRFWGFCVLSFVYMLEIHKKHNDYIIWKYDLFSFGNLLGILFFYIYKHKFYQQFFFKRTNSILKSETSSSPSSWFLVNSDWLQAFFYLGSFFRICYGVSSVPDLHTNKQTTSAGHLAWIVRKMYSTSTKQAQGRWTGGSENQD